VRELEPERVSGAGKGRLGLWAVERQNMKNFDLGEALKKAMEEAVRERGHANVLIAGSTGVGKSTLINQVFQGDFATTGQGKPVTKETRAYTKPNSPLTIYDTRGLELADFAITLKELKTLISTKRQDPDPRNHMHVAWVCIAEDSRRIQQAEMDLTEMLVDLMPVLVVLTKSRADQGFRAEAQRLLPRAANVIRVRAIPEALDDGHKLPPMGLQELVQATVDLIPEGQRRAFVAAQKADLELKKKHSRFVVAGAVTAAVGAGAIPIPFSDAALLLPIQLGMLAGISATYGLELSTAFLSTLVSSAVGGGATTMAGRAIVANLIKLIPGAGSVVGGSISGAVAGALTTALGEAYIQTLDVLFTRHDGERPTPEEILESMKKAPVKA